ncbi:hypothetical protein BZG36_04359, partial [Bifiguratus adelaidae]
FKDELSRFITTRFDITEDIDGIALHRFLRAHFDLPIAAVHQWLKKGKVKLRGPNSAKSTRPRANTLLRVGDVVTVRHRETAVPIVVDSKPLNKSVNGGLDVLYEDEYILAINKPSGLSTQGGSKVSVAVLDFLSQYRNDRGESPRIVHRLDKPTSGVLCLGKTRNAAMRLSSAFQRAGPDSIGKEYLAIVVGPVEPSQVPQTIDASLVVRNGNMDIFNGSTHSDDDKELRAITRYNVVARLEADDGMLPLTLLQLWPLTGRKHQLRIHCACCLQAPILGDFKYGKHSDSINLKHLLEHYCDDTVGASTATHVVVQGDPPKARVARQTHNNTPFFLHMHRLTLAQLSTSTSDIITITAPLPAYFQQLLSKSTWAWFSDKLKACGTKHMG